MSRQEERRLIERSVRGDAPAFEVLVRRYEDRIYRQVRSVCASAPSEADDVYQDTFLTAYKKLSSFKGRSELGTWLYRVAANLCFMRLRSNKVRAAAPLDAEAAPDPDAAPEEAVRKKELSAAVTRALSALPADHRVVVVLRDVEGLSAAETAAELGLSVAAVKSRLHRGRAELRRVLKTA